MNGHLFKVALEGMTHTEIEPLAQLLSVDLSHTPTGLVGEQTRARLWEELSYFGSHNFAYLLRGLEGVDYPEILGDVCKRMKLKVTVEDDLDSVIAAERALVEKLFGDMWDQMSEAERRDVGGQLGVEGATFNAGGSAAVSAILAGNVGGFGAYQLAVIVANAVSRALLGRGLAFAGNAALTRGLGVVLGPVGWIASGLWLASDLASPAFRKTLPAVVMVASLRELAGQRRIIGVMGPRSTGKDSLLKYLFGIDTGNIKPIPGSTSSVALYDTVTTRTPARVLNFPGFGDHRLEVEREVSDQAISCSAILFVFNGSAVLEAERIAEFQRYKNLVGKHGRPFVIPVLNKWDKTDDDERMDLLSVAAKSLGVEVSELVCTSLKPANSDPAFESGLALLRHRLNEWAATQGLEPLFDSGLPRG